MLSKESLLIFLSALAFGLVANPVAMRLARYFDLMDRPGHRKIHKHVVPKLGGFAVFSALLFAVGVGLTWGGVHLVPDAVRKITFILGATLAAAILGVCDDKYDLKPRYKFAWQVVIAGCFAYFGYRFEFFHAPGFPVYHLAWMALPLTVLWMVAVVNGFNFMDGVDGLAASVTMVTLVGMGFISHVLHASVLSLLWPAALGAVAAFAVYNRAPAKIYLGDSGAYLLGMFTAACLVSLGLGDDKNAVSLPFWDEELRFHLIAATLFVGYPMLEVTLSTVRRGVLKITTGRSMEWSEREHIHHRLLKLGVQPHMIGRAAVIFEFLTVSAAILLIYKEGARATLVMSPIVVMLSYVMPKLGFFDFLDPKAIEHNKPHYKIVRHFIEMQRAKLGLSLTRGEVITLLRQTCDELGVTRFKFSVSGDSRGKGGLDYAHRWKAGGQQHLDFLRPQAKVKPGDQVFSDQCFLADHKGAAHWVFEPHTEEGALDIEYRVLAYQFMNAALQRVVELRAGKGDSETTGLMQVAEKPLRGHALRKRHKGEYKR